VKADGEGVLGFKKSARYNNSCTLLFHLREREYSSKLTTIIYVLEIICFLKIRRYRYHPPAICCSQQLKRTATLEIDLVLTVSLGDALNLVLLLDGVGIRRPLSSVDKLISKAFSNGLDVAERSFACASGEEVQSLVYTTERRNIDGLRRGKKS
jgi:hypothetical protein